MAFPVIRVSADLAEHAGPVCLGCLVYSVRVTAETPAVWAFYEKEVAPGLTQRLAATDLAAMPGIGSSRRVLKACGTDPGRYRISSEALYRRVRQGKDLYRVNSVVDANNLVSLETGLSLGSYDLAHIEGDIVFRRGEPDETYAGIGKGTVPLSGMPLVSDDQGAFGSPVSDSRRALISTETAHVLTVIYGFSGREACETALQLAALRFVDLCGAECMETELITC